jgi:hypothetical protein
MSLRESHDTNTRAARSSVARRAINRPAVAVLALAGVLVGVSGLDGPQFGRTSLWVDGVGDLVDGVCATALVAACAVALVRRAEDVVLRVAFVALGMFSVWYGVSTVEYLHPSSPSPGPLIRCAAGIVAAVGLAMLLWADWRGQTSRDRSAGLRVAVLLALLAGTAQLGAAFLPAFDLGGGARLSTWELGRFADLTALIAAGALIVMAVAAWHWPHRRLPALLAALCAGYLGLPGLRQVAHGLADGAPRPFLCVLLVAAATALACVASWVMVAYPRR